MIRYPPADVEYVHAQAPVEEPHAVAENHLYLYTGNPVHGFWYKPLVFMFMM